MSSDPRVTVVSRALHLFHGTGYCSMGEHQPNINYYCYDEANAILAALDDVYQPAALVTSRKVLTLSARQGRHRG